MFIKKRHYRFDGDYSRLYIYLPRHVYWSPERHASKANAIIPIIKRRERQFRLIHIHMDDIKHHIFKQSCNHMSGKTRLFNTFSLDPRTIPVEDDP
jgi:hypothetical protein